MASLKKPTIALTAFAIATTGTIILFSSIDRAEARPSTRSYTCSALKQFVRQRGAVVMNHKSSSLYRRFVHSRRYCDYDETVRPFSVPTKTGQCRLYICDPINLLFGD